MPNECKAPMMQFTLDFAFSLALWAAAARCERPCNCYFSKLVFGKFCFSLLLKWRSSRNSLWTAEGQTIFFFSFCVNFLLLLFFFPFPFFSHYRAMFAIVLFPATEQQEQVDERGHAIALSLQFFDQSQRGVLSPPANWPSVQLLRPILLLSPIAGIFWLHGTHSTLCIVQSVIYYPRFLMITHLGFALCALHKLCSKMCKNLYNTVLFALDSGAGFQIVWIRCALCIKVQCNLMALYYVHCALVYWAVWCLCSFILWSFVRSVVWCFSPVCCLVAIIKIISLLLGQTRIEANQRCSALLSGTSLSCVPPCHFSFSLVTFAFHPVTFAFHFCFSLVAFAFHLSLLILTCHFSVTCHLYFRWSLLLYSSCLGQVCHACHPVTFAFFAMRHRLTNVSFHSS